MTFRHVPSKLAIAPLLAAALAFTLPAFGPASAQVADMQLSMKQQTAIRCSAAFAVVAAIQARGGGNEYPDLNERGREFFVRAAAQIMDEEGANREQIADLMFREAAELHSDFDRLDAVMPPCLLLLNSSGI